MSKRTCTLGPVLSNTALVAICAALVFVLVLFSTQNTEAQTFSVLHYFTGGNDGAAPVAGLTAAGAGKFYGTTLGGGTYDGGVVFQLTYRGEGWILSPLYALLSQQFDGADVAAGAVIGPNGHLYGTTQGYGMYGYGNVFELTPPPSVCKSANCSWNETILHSFAGPDGGVPGPGNLLFDRAGNIYGTTTYGGANGEGVAYELSPSGGGWTEQVLYSFTGNPDGSSQDGAKPYGGLIFDAAGDLYGTTIQGGSCWPCGTLFELSPSSGNWTETILHDFNIENDGSCPVGTLLMDPQGNLYGTDGGCDAPEAQIFELTPSGGTWGFSVINTFGACGGNYGGYYAGLTRDDAGNFYGVCASGPPGSQSQYGFVFELTYNGTWTLTDLHDFTGSDGAFPTGPVVFDLNGNLYGTAQQGGMGDCAGSELNGCGTIWEITP